MATAKKPPVKKASTVTHIHAIVERRHYSSEGVRLSPPPFPQYYTPLEWLNFQESGPKIGIYLKEILAAPDGVDTSYSLMSPK